MSLAGLAGTVSQGMPAPEAGQQVQRQSEIQGETDRLTDRLNYLQDRVGLLRERLNSVLREDIPSPTSSGDQTKEMAVTSPLAQWIRCECNTVVATISVVEDILQRLEV